MSDRRGLHVVPPPLPPHHEAPEKILQGAEHIDQQIRKHVGDIENILSLVKDTGERGTSADKFLMHVVRSPDSHGVTRLTITLRPHKGKKGVLTLEAIEQADHPPKVSHIFSDPGIEYINLHPTPEHPHDTRPAPLHSYYNADTIGRDMRTPYDAQRVKTLFETLRRHAYPFVNVQYILEPEYAGLKNTGRRMRRFVDLF